MIQTEQQTKNFLGQIIRNKKKKIVIFMFNEHKMNVIHTFDSIIYLVCIIKFCSIIRSYIQLC